MNTWLIVLTSSAVGVLMSSVIGFVGQILERRSRREELLFKAAVEISQANAERAAEDSEKFTPGLELAMVEKTYEILGQVYKTGEMSDTNKAFLKKFLANKEKSSPEK